MWLWHCVKMHLSLFLHFMFIKKYLCDSDTVSRWDASFSPSVSFSTSFLLPIFLLPSLFFLYILPYVYLPLLTLPFLSLPPSFCFVLSPSPPFFLPLLCFFFPFSLPIGLSPVHPYPPLSPLYCSLSSSIYFPFLYSFNSPSLFLLTSHPPSLFFLPLWLSHFPFPSPSLSRYLLGGGFSPFI